MPSLASDTLRSNKITLYRPVKPWLLNQGFGSNFAYYNSHFGTQGHTGIDLYAPHGTPVYAAHDGVASFHKDSHGGEGVYVAAPGFMTIYWHLIGDTDSAYPSPISLDGMPKIVKAGDLVGYSDNTGAPFESTGDHLHFGLQLLDSDSKKLYPANGFDGCVDPQPYLSGTFAQDVKTLVGLYQKLLPLLEALVRVLQGK